MAVTDKHILVVDDEPDIRHLVQEILQEEGYSVAVAENGDSARREVKRRRPDLVLLDIWMPDVDGITLLQEWSEQGALPFPVIMISGHGTVETAVEATRRGAFDFIEKPLSLTRLLVTVERALESTAARPPRCTVPEGVAPDLVGKSKVMQAAREKAERIASFDTAVLIRGESGSGKKSFAYYIHKHSQRHAQPFVVMNASAARHGRTSAIELFGQQQGGEVHAGLLEQAQGGTLFIDEIGELEADLQARLNAVLENRTFVREGGTETVSCDVRIIVSSSQNLEAMIERGEFREDLFYQLNVIPFEVPSLREHCEDVPELLNYYVARFVDNEKLAYRHFSVAAQNRLRNYKWPGNILELKNLVQRLLILGGEEDIGVDEIDQSIVSSSANQASQTPPAGVDSGILELPLREAREKFEREYLQQQLQACNGSVGELAKIVGMERTNLYRKLRTLGIDVKQK